MPIKIVLLWTDWFLWGGLFAALLYGRHVLRQPQLRSQWRRVWRDPAALASAVLLTALLGVTLVDSLHFRRALPPVPGQPADRVFYAARTESLLDVLLARPLAGREATYSAPLAWQGFIKESRPQPDGQVRRERPRLSFGGAHLANPASDWPADLLLRAALGAAGAALLAAGLLWASLGAMRRMDAALAGLDRPALWRSVLADRSEIPWRAGWVMLAALLLLCGMAVALGGGYHVLGTDGTGNDVLVQALKSVRTAFVIGSMASLATLPLAIALGVLAGWFGGWVDEVIQYVYTVLSSVPNVLLIAACVLMVQVFLDKHPELFETGAERADLKLFLLCAVLGLTGWAGLCRLLRAETLKLRELEYVEAAQAFGVGHARIMRRHIFPNVAHLMLIVTVLDFSALILYEAVLSYVGVGVDPSMHSFGGMINLARSEMSRDPVVWWSFASAFGFMVALVLAANLFADGVRDAFDPRTHAMRPRLALRRGAR